MNRIVNKIVGFFVIIIFFNSCTGFKEYTSNYGSEITENFKEIDKDSIGIFNPSIILISRNNEVLYNSLKLKKNKEVLKKGILLASNKSRYSFFDIAKRKEYQENLIDFLKLENEIIRLGYLYSKVYSFNSVKNKSKLLADFLPISPEFSKLSKTLNCRYLIHPTLIVKNGSSNTGKFLLNTIIDLKNCKIVFRDIHYFENKADKYNLSFLYSQTLQNLR
jgi:hypothetical protein